MTLFRPCSRRTKAGQVCPSKAQDWTWAAASGLPDPGSCRRHMTGPEHLAWLDGEAAHAQRDAEEALKLFPACWSWPITQAHQERAWQASRHRSHYATPEQREYGQRCAICKGPCPQGYATMDLVHDWQAGRCGICGDEMPRAQADHDHLTGYFRGLLCLSCNIGEGHAYNDEPVYARYRFRPPAAILGLSIYLPGPDDWKAVAEARILARNLAERDPARRG